MTLFLIGLWVASVILVLFPYVIYPAALRLLPTLQIVRNAEIKRRVTLQFCAYNESAAIPEKLRNIEALKHRYPDLEVLAFDDGSSDDTFEQLAARPDLLTVLRGGGRKGKAHGMKLLAARAKGDILVFTDANVTLEISAIDNLMAWYADPQVGGICGTLKYLGDGESATASVGGFYWRLEERIKAEESRTGNVMGADGSIFSLRRVLYPTFPDSVLDDLTVSMAAVFSGYRLIKVEDVVAYERLIVVRGEEFRRKVRIAARAYHTHRYLRQNLKRMTVLDRFKYTSHKLLRWFGGGFLILGVVASVALATSVSLALGAAVVVLLGGLTASAMSVSRGPIAAMAEIMLAMMATLIGVAEAMRGKVVVTWTPANSR
jgi:cellulose synthase/poly-beta-1,6-N-acetylglucosamine synthase-like glycosyltransferase